MCQIHFLESILVGKRLSLLYDPNTRQAWEIQVTLLSNSKYPVGFQQKWVRTFTNIYTPIVGDHKKVLRMTVINHVENITPLRMGTNHMENIIPLIEETKKILLIFIIIMFVNILGVGVHFMLS